MIIVITIIFIILTALFIFISYRKPEDSDSRFGFGLLAVISGIAVLIGVCLEIVYIYELKTAYTIDLKIAMYQEENDKIEKSIDEIVNNYLKHEHDTYSDIKTDNSSMNLVTLFPELNSDDLIQKQLDIFTENNHKIKDLKEQKISIAHTRWLVYFGK